MPGFWLLSLESGAATLVLSALLERPFVSLAGVRHHALAHSIVATGVTALPMFFAGWALLIAGFSMLSDVLLVLWMPASVAVSSAIKYAWLNRRRSIWRGSLRAWPIVVGAIVSAVVVALLPVLQVPFGFGRASHASSVADVRPWAALLSFGGAVSAVVIAAGYTRKDLTNVDVVQPHGFEVLPPTNS